LTVAVKVRVYEAKAEDLVIATQKMFTSGAHASRIVPSVVFGRQGR